MTTLAMLRFARLVSPALPIGGFAYSDGLETAVARGWVSDEAGAHAWITGRLDAVLAAVDLPVLARLARALAAGDDAGFRAWNLRLRATRDSREARDGDRQLGNALARLLDDLGVDAAAPWRSDERATLAAGFALAGRAWELAEPELLAAYAWTWAEAQVAAAVKLVPLGQTAGQRILGALTEGIPARVDRARATGDRDIGGTAPRAALATMLHETQRVRLFRS